MKKRTAGTTTPVTAATTPANAVAVTSIATPATPSTTTANSTGPVPEPGSSPQPLLAPLGLHGLAHLDAPVLAALASETPLLLIGAHGSAKSALLQRLAAALQLEHRHYNASLIAFDDLVGFPVPDGDGLRYLRTPATLWGAHSVFLDEISRCRPDVQNKLFSIIHERRVQGIPLPDLRHRWAAMNPPAGVDDDASDTDAEQYLGSQPLDPALADRFGFVLVLPALDELPPEARRAVIRSGLPGADGTPACSELPALVAHCRQGLAVVAALQGDWITAYTAALVVPLRQAGLAISGRRAAMLAANIAAVHAAKRSLGSPATVADAARIALGHSLPQRALGRRIEAGLLNTLHRQAVEAAEHAEGNAVVARILDEADPVRRVGLALQALHQDADAVTRHTMSLLVSDALASQGKQARWVLAQSLLPELAELDCVDAQTLEQLAEPFAAQLHFENRPNLQHTVPRSRIAGFDAVVRLLGELDASDPAQVALGNLGAALYAVDDRESDPSLLRRQQARMTSLLAGERHAD